MVTALLLGTLALTGWSHADPGYAARVRPPYVELSTGGDGTYHRGDQVRVYFRSDSDGFLTLFRVDTDGRVRILFPEYPWQDNYVYGGRRYEVTEPYGHGDFAFVADEYPGQGYLFAVVSYDPFDYSAFTARDHWDYRAIGYGGRVTGDPYVAFMDLVDYIVPAGYRDYAYDVFPYYVEYRYSYPRFLCYDCHSHVGFTYWNPYRYSCVRFRLVIYDDPYYYPARAYAGTRVVYTRPVRYEPRYVFKDRTPAKPYVTTERRRVVEGSTGRRPVDRGVTGRDLGGVGRIPAPVTREPTARPGDDSPGARRPSPTPTVEADAGAPPSAPDRRRPAGRSAEANEQNLTERPQLERREPAARSLRPTTDPRVTPRRGAPGDDQPATRPAPRARPETGENEGVKPRSQSGRAEPPASRRLAPRGKSPRSPAAQEADTQKSKKKEDRRRDSD